MTETVTKKVTNAKRRKPPAAGKGRPKGALNKTTRNIREAIEKAFNQAGGVEYLTKLALEDPKVFIPLLAKIIPSEVNATHSGGLTLIVDTGIRRDDPKG